MTIKCDAGTVTDTGLWVTHRLDLGIPLYGGRKEDMAGSNPAVVITKHLTAPQHLATNQLHQTEHRRQSSPSGTGQRP